MTRLANTLRSRLTRAHLIATVALSIALGGGYAVAFSGSGTLQKAGLTGISASFEDLRTLNEFGTLQVRCDTDEDEMEYQLDNTTSTEINVLTANASGLFIPTSVSANSTGGGFGSNANVGSVRVHLFKEGATGTTAGKAGVEIVVSNDGPISNNCGTAEVRVLALNTQE